MKNTDPKNLALNNALLVIGVFTILYFIFSYIFFSIKLLPLLLIDVILFVFCYFTFRYTIETFVYEKIKIIYKTIHNLKLPKDQKRRRLAIRGDSIDKVNQEVMEWGENKTREIEELKKLATYRREFIGNVSHELKTPIFNIQGYVLTLLDGALEDPKINREYLLRTERSINRMIAIVEDLEAIARLESGELKLNMEDFDLLTLTGEVIEFLEIKAKEKNNRIYFAENYEKSLMVNADKDKMRQVMTNLIDNSIKYGKKENGKTKISFFDMDENYLVEVTDNGVGMAKQDIPRVFERFYRTDKGRSREQGGTGLGLSIVKHIIEAHDQTINVRSTLGVGTTFAFTLSKAKKG
ncbi:MAG: sensor histidine kinase [Bacteroidales bacterium]|nr:sensor histidine kinase [Bacteroidales bacterium]